MAGVLILATGCTANVEHPNAVTPPTPPAGTAAIGAPAPFQPLLSDSDNPLTAAVGWLVAYRSARWTDSTPAAWIDRVKPYVTDTLNNTYKPLRSGNGGTDWANYVRQHCTSTITDTHAVIPPESPGTDTAANVQVTGTVRTTCTSGVPASPNEQASATLVVVKTAAGWRVDQRLF